MSMGVCGKEQGQRSRASPSVLKGRPHLVLERPSDRGRAVDVSHGFVAFALGVRGPDVVERVVDRMSNRERVELEAENI